MNETPVNAPNSSIIRQKSNIIPSQNFLMFSSVLFVEGRPDRCWSSSDMSPLLNGEKPFVNPCLFQSFFFKSLSKHCDSLWCFFSPKGNKPRCKNVLLLSLSSNNRLSLSSNNRLSLSSKNRLSLSSNNRLSLSLNNRLSLSSNNRRKQW